MIKLNFNTQVKVKLNKYGKDIYFHSCDNVPLIKPSYPKIDKEGFSTFQLWEFMNIYGSYLNMAKPPICEDINFYIEEEEITTTDGCPKTIISYLCDRRQCENCSYPVCKHTLDITHAVNFICEAGSFKEIEKTTINIKNVKNFNRGIKK